MVCGNWKGHSGQLRVALRWWWAAGGGPPPPFLLLKDSPGAPLAQPTKGKEGASEEGLRGLFWRKKLPSVQTVECTASWLLMLHMFVYHSSHSISSILISVPLLKSCTG